MRAKEVGDRAGEGRACGNLGNAYQTLGDFCKAAEYHEPRPGGGLQMPVGYDYLKQRAGKRLNMHPKHEPVTKQKKDTG